MAALYADENVDIRIVERLRDLGHDVLRVYDDGRANLGIADPDVLDRATELGRAVLTNNRGDYHRLHRLTPGHAGIITYTDDEDRPTLARRIDAQISAVASLAGQLLRIVKPNPSSNRGNTGA